MVTSSDWRIEFRSEFGFEFNELEFEDESIERNLKILAARLDGLTLDSIGREFGVTRERIRQIVNKLMDRAQKLTDDTNVDLWSLYEQKLELLKNAPKIKLVEEVNSIELKARKVINNNPGISII